jgi:hypothetical protein
MIHVLPRLRRSLPLVAAVALVLGGQARATPPNGLTQQGLLTWHLDALLHDTFGTQAVVLRTWGDFPPPWGKSRHGSWDFALAATGFLGNCCSPYWLSTFADAQGAAFTLQRPRVAPRPVLGASGGEMPLSVGGRFIACGHDRWLYTHVGNGAANFQLNCWVPPRP